MFFKGWPDPPEPPPPAKRLRAITPTRKSHPHLKKFRKAMHQNPTPDELMVAAMLHYLDIKFARQQVFNLQGVKSYIADFWIWERKLVLECDGASHDTAEARAYDVERDGRFSEAGMKTLRIKSAEIRRMSPFDLMNRMAEVSPVK